MLHSTASRSPSTPTEPLGPIPRSRRDILLNEPSTADTEPGYRDAMLRTPYLPPLHSKKERTDRSHTAHSTVNASTTSGSSVQVTCQDILSTYGRNVFAHTSAMSKEPTHRNKNRKDSDSRPRSRQYRPTSVASVAIGFTEYKRQQEGRSSSEDFLVEDSGYALLTSSDKAGAQEDQRELPVTLQNREPSWGNIRMHKSFEEPKPCMSVDKGQRDSFGNNAGSASLSYNNTQGSHTRYARVSSEGMDPEEPFVKNEEEDVMCKEKSDQQSYCSLDSNRMGEVSEAACCSQGLQPTTNGDMNSDAKAHIDRQGNRYFKEDQLSTQPHTLTRRAVSADRRFSRQEMKPNNFRLAKESGKDICVCGASAFWERERISLRTKRLRLEQKTQKLREEVASLRETRDLLHSRLLDLETMETDIKSRSEVIVARELAMEEESTRLMALSTEIRASRAKLDQFEQDITQREHDVEVSRRKHEKEVAAMREQENLINTESRRLRDLAQRMAQKRAELTASEELFQQTKQQLKSIRDELQQKTVFLDERNQELLTVAHTISEEKKKLEERELNVQQTEKQLRSREQRIEEEERALVQEQEALARERSTLESEREEIAQHYETIKEQALLAEKQKYEWEGEHLKRQQIWEEEMSKERHKLEEGLKALERRHHMCDKTEATVKVSEEQFKHKQEQLVSLETSLKLREESLIEMEKKNTKTIEEVERLRSSLEMNHATLVASQHQVKEQQSRATAQLEVLGREREHLAQEMDALHAQKAKLDKKDAELAEAKSQLDRREAVLLSKEARSKWHQDVMKDISDMKDRYELQLQDFELEKQSFAEMKATILSQHEQAAATLRLREQSLASLEASIRAKHAEMLRREKLANLRGSAQQCLTQSPSRSTTKGPIAASSSAGTRNDAPSRRGHHNVSEKRHLYDSGKSKSTKNTLSHKKLTMGSLTGSISVETDVCLGSLRTDTRTPMSEDTSGKECSAESLHHSPPCNVASLSRSTRLNSPTLDISSRIKPITSMSSPRMIDHPYDAVNTNPTSLLPTYPVSACSTREANTLHLLEQPRALQETPNTRNHHTLRSLHQTGVVSKPSVFPFEATSLSFSNHAFDTLVLKDKLDSLKPLDVSTASIPESPLLAMHSTS